MYHAESSHVFSGFTAFLNKNHMIEIFYKALRKLRQKRDKTPVQIFTSHKYSHTANTINQSKMHSVQLLQTS